MELEGTIQKKITMEQNKQLLDRDGNPITKERVEEVFKEIFYGDKNADPVILNNKILSGYLYTLTWSDLSTPREKRIKIEGQLREIMLGTGKAGVETYIKSCREQGIPDKQIGDSIWLQIEDGDNGKWVTINQLTVNAKENSNQEKPDPHKEQ